ncbi:hypothetical protein GQ44DRAFT_306663 [Phaeosphaeriaceae sp. PMI808]|nr:hypothetical protein GQ44DRAFT_306663 [Phaeosphaeriaceae sp. PMI808]
MIPESWSDHSKNYDSHSAKNCGQSSFNCVILVTCQKVGLVQFLRTHNISDILILVYFRVCLSAVFLVVHESVDGKSVKGRYKTQRGEDNSDYSKSQRGISNHDAVLCVSHTCMSSFEVEHCIDCSLNLLRISVDLLNSLLILFKAFSRLSDYSFFLSGITCPC